MNAMDKADRQVDANHNRRMANQNRAIERREREMNEICDRAESMIGHLCREGKKVFYAIVNGKYMEGNCEFAFTGEVMKALRK